jgi:hypothetical protein
MPHLRLAGVIHRSQLFASHGFTDYHAGGPVGNGLKNMKIGGKVAP